MKLKMLAFSALASIEISLKSRLILQVNTSPEYCRTKLSKTKHTHTTFHPVMFVMKSATFYLLIEISFSLHLKKSYMYSKRKPMIKKNQRNESEKSPYLA